MHASKEELPVAMTMPGGEFREAEWGGMTVSFDTIPAGTETAPLFKGLPGDSCQCPHWGYLFKGRILVRYADREETITAGQAYYFAPGHVPVFLEDCEVVEFSETAERRRTAEVVRGNLGAAAG